MKYNGMDYNDYLVEQALDNMGDAEFAAMMAAGEVANNFYKSM
jgi:hypothetical protein